MLVTIENGRATQLRGDPDHPVTRGFLCAKVSRYLEREYSTERLLYPVEDGLFVDLELGGSVPVSRERAIERRRDVHRTFMEAFDSDVIIVTMGFVECWFDNTTGLAIHRNGARRRRSKRG